MEMGKFILKSINKTHPDINIGPGEASFIGRTPETEIRDLLISKRQLKVRADIESKILLVELLGMNPAFLNKKRMVAKMEYQAIADDVIELLDGKYPYKVCFEGANPIVRNEMKRRSSDDFTVSAAKQRRKWECVYRLDAELKPGWESYNDEHLIVYTSKNSRSSSKIASYDMDGTLITTRSGKVFPTDANDWKILFANIKSTLTTKLSLGYKIVIFTNQAGISSGKTNLVDIQFKIERIVAELSVPIQVFIAAANDCFRKPLTGMWQVLCEYKNDNLPIDFEQSYYVGDAAGRPESRSIGTKKDHSCVDRLFAKNLGLKFFTPEEHFRNAHAGKWVRPEFEPQDFLKTELSVVEPGIDIVKEEHELIIMVGGPGSGKSHFCRTYLATNGYKIINRDTLGTWQKCLQQLEDCLRSGRRAVVDNTNGTKEARRRFVAAALKSNVSCRCFVMSTSFRNCEHNIAFRELIDTTHAKISKMVMNTYKKNYQIPSSEEGFAEIVNVNFKPIFPNEEHRSLYGMYLLPA